MILKILMGEAFCIYKKDVYPSKDTDKEIKLKMLTKYL